MQIKKVKTEENRLKIKNGKTEWNPTFELEDILIEQKRFPPRSNRYVILQEGRQQAEKPQNGEKDLFTPLTTKEIQELIKREMAKARMKIKPISLNMFIILFLMQIFTLVGLIMVMSGVRIG